MATTPLSRRLQLQFQSGTTATGRPKIANRYFPHVNPSAADADVLAVGQALAPLFADSLYQIAVVEQDAIS